MFSPENQDILDLQSAICFEYCTITPNAYLSDAILQMTQEKETSRDLSAPKITGQSLPLIRTQISCALVINQEKLVGILTERDIVKLANLNSSFETTTVEEVMTSPVITLSSEEFTDLFLAYNLMRRHRIRHLPIVDEKGYPIGIVTQGSLRQALHLGYFLRFRQVEEIMINQVVCAPSSTSIAELVEIMTRHRISCIVIVENQDNMLIPVGIITERDIVQFQAMKLNLHECDAKTFMSKPLFCVKPRDSVVGIHQKMNELRVRRFVVTGDKGELVGLITESNLSQLLDPIEIYGVLEIFRRRVNQLEREKALLLEGKGLELHKALENSEFLIYYQPQFNIRTGKVVGAEALIRWKSPQKGMIPPDKFIPVAESTNFIIPLGKWVLNRVCSQIRLWQESGLEMVPIAVNISSRQFYQTDLVSDIMAILEDNKIEPCWLKLELTESILVENIEITLNQFKRLNNIGIQIAIDDFGTGYASLGYLQHFPFNALKLDRSFIRNIHQNSKNAAITTAIIRMAQQLDFEVVAEGVEIPEERDFLYQHGCEVIQGYLISPPLPVLEFDLFLTHIPHCKHTAKRSTSKI